MRRLLAILAGTLMVIIGSPGAANALGGNPDMLPAGSTACTNWVQSSHGAFMRGRADYNRGTFTTRMSSTIGGPETTIFTMVTREVLIRQPGLPYPTYRVLATPPTSGTVFLRNCVSANEGPLYRFNLTIEPNGGTYDLGPYQATLGPGGRHCGDFVEGPSIGLDDGATHFVGNSTAPVLFYLTGTDGDYAFMGGIFMVPGTSVDQVYIPDSNVSSLSGCVQNTSTTTATVSFELTAV